MPFLDDIDGDDDALQHPIWGAFALLKDNLERLMMANIGWSLQLLPAIAALAFPQLPFVVRLLLLLYSAIALTPATGILYTWMARVNQRETLRLEMLREDFRNLALPSLLRLAPLFGLLGIGYAVIVLLGLVHILLLDVLARFGLLVLLVCALYWGPLFAEYPGRSPFSILRQSLLLIWNYPGQTAVTGLFVILIAAGGVISIAGFFLIAPVIVALLQTRRCFALLAREQARQKKFKVDMV
ncbi:MAG TPA: hypothetical protein VKV19_11730 [Ktedonobacteraceae bacterium]|jgi:hypothetical protein|nr:hypothetical protein [Ktedonobacteraceae bacterium]